MCSSAKLQYIRMWLYWETWPLKGTSRLNEVTWLGSIPVWLVCVCVCLLSCVRLFVTPWTKDCQAPLSLGFPRQEYWSRLSFPSPRDFPDPGSEPSFLHLLHYQVDSLPLSHLGSSHDWYTSKKWRLEHRQAECVGTTVSSHLQARDRALRRNQSCWHRDLGLTASRTMRK